ncbi:hypothetical protein GUITHDRAFT_149059 [Guillardia theta CCMP2712]|uniref:Uncharacterized protein n=1 Tax=Guillardia theta (strain CCMP2712) TaxID=905079 RepID=L1I6F9_GUITC|nr:hypothetical protein GUITHDRAFT_149059 [Guillardia theta CCMP2712]EKX31806.1 hypothetical protein GUITHDRAFT_149059 [Guillardia theta CCMP2712]|eukprot:XP_005818786.1 hypothetical protein GUITHDRAFT_149059 [Guillardia theta CCMP2712]
MSGNGRLILTLLFALCVLDPACEAFTNLSKSSLPVAAPWAENIASSIAQVVGAGAWLAIWSNLAKYGMIDPKVSRKIVHCGSGPLFLLTWPLFSSSHTAPLLASIGLSVQSAADSDELPAVPTINALRLAGEEEGRGESDGRRRRDSGLVTAISRSGRSEEVMQGPLIYTLVLLWGVVGGWQQAMSITAITQMAAGDGLADIVGRRWGVVKWPWSDSKSIAGSLGFVVGASVVMMAELLWFNAFGLLSFKGTEVYDKVILISLLCAAVELIPLDKVLPGRLGDDNVTVPAVAAVLALLLLR